MIIYKAIMVPICKMQTWKQNDVVFQMNGADSPAAWAATNVQQDDECRTKRIPSFTTAFRDILL